jgi:hypothetical protein
MFYRVLLYLETNWLGLVAVIRQFLCDRIGDESGLKETAQGLTALQRMSRFSGEDAVQVATT